MATVVYTNATALVNGADWSGDCNQLGLSIAAEMLDATTFGKNTRIHKSGITVVAATINGFINESSSTEGTVRPSRYGDDWMGSGGDLVALFPTSITVGSTSGNGCGYAFKAVEASFNRGSAIGTLLPFTVNLHSQGTEA